MFSIVNTYNYNKTKDYLFTVARPKNFYNLGCSENNITPNLTPAHATVCSNS